MMEEKSVLLAEMTWEEAKDLAETGAAAVVPTGSTEQHGPHMPLKTDHYLVYEVAVRAALLASSKVEVLVAPVIPYGCSGVHMEFSGTMTVSQTVYIQMVKELGQSLVNGGFKRVLFLNGHGGNFAPLVVAAKDLYDLTGATIAVANYFHQAPKAVADLRESPLGGICHSGELETSCMLFLDPESVRTDRAARAIPQWKTEYVLDDLMKGGRAGLAYHVADVSPMGTLGDPSIATREKGEKWIEAMIRGVADLIVDFASWETRRMCTFK